MKIVAATIVRRDREKKTKIKHSLKGDSVFLKNEKQIKVEKMEGNVLKILSPRNHVLLNETFPTVFRVFSVILLFKFLISFATISFSFFISTFFSQTRKKVKIKMSQKTNFACKKNTKMTRKKM